MANSPSSRKRALQADRRAAVNKARRSRMRTFVRKVEEAIAAGEQAAAAEALRLAQPEIMRSVSRGVLHKNTASRKISRLAGRVKSLGACRRLTPAAPAARHSRFSAPDDRQRSPGFRASSAARAAITRYACAAARHISPTERCSAFGPVVAPAELRYCWCHGAIPDRRDFRVKQRILLCRCSIDCDTSVAVQYVRMVLPE